MATGECREDVVKEELSKFLKKHSADATLHDIDEIVLSYMVSILEEIGSDGLTEDAFDIETFTEMMEAYIPGFVKIDSVDVCEWMFELSTTLNKEDTEKTPPTEQLFRTQLSLESPSKGNKEPESHLTDKSQSNKRTYSTSERESQLENASLTSRNATNQEKSNPTEDKEEKDEKVELLNEMFPGTCNNELIHCLGVTGGDIEGAVQLVLTRQETGQTITEKSRIQNSSKKSTNGHVAELNDDQVLKNIVKKYSYVNTDEDKRQHRPVMPKFEGKKMTRYLDGKIVSTKGERFTEVKKDEGEDMKKTYVSLKPARKYRFH